MRTENIQDKDTNATSGYETPTTPSQVRLLPNNLSSNFLTVVIKRHLLRISSLSDLVNALASNRHNDFDGVRVDAAVGVELQWPRERCRLLSDDVILVDSPGVDVDIDFDEWYATCF